MEGVGARLGRSSTRYGPVPVFNGPVRKWRKKWIPNSNTNNNKHSHSHNGTPPTSNGNNGSHLLLYKWTPLSLNNNSNGDKSFGEDEVAAELEEAPRRKFRFIPIAVLEERGNEAAEKVDDEAKPIDTDPSAVEPTPKREDVDKKPDINDVPIEENQYRENNLVVRQDLNESTLD